jgi:hypothetical protein
MMARAALLVGICLSTAGAQYSCSSDGSGMFTSRDLNSGDGPAFSTTLALRDSTGSEVSRFSRMEFIRMELTVRNRTDMEQTLQMPSAGLAATFIAFDEGADSPRWRSTDGLAFAAVVTQIVFQPHETKVMALDWNQELANGTFLPNGNYEARGMVQIVGFPQDPLAPHELGSNLSVFTVY